MYDQKNWKQDLKAVFVHPCSQQHNSQGQQSGSNSRVPWWINGLTNVANIYTMESYSSLKRKEILTRTTIWMKLEDIIPWELSHSLKYKWLEESSSEMEPKMTNAWWWEIGDGCRGVVWKDKKSFGDLLHTIWKYLILLNYIF